MEDINFFIKNSSLVTKNCGTFSINRAHVGDSIHPRKCSTVSNLMMIVYAWLNPGLADKEIIEEYLAHHFEPKPNDRFDIEP